MGSRRRYNIPAIAHKMKKAKVNYRNRNLLFVDLETTGLDPEFNEIVEVGCILVDGKTLEIISEYSAKIKPKHIGRASEEAIKVSGYSPKLWKNAKDIKEVLKKVAEMAPGAMIAGWKVDFDWWFLEHAFKVAHIAHDFDYHLVDVISLAYVYFRKKKRPIGLGLRKVASYFKIKMEEQHDALGDIKGTYLVFRKLMNFYEK